MKTAILFFFKSRVVEKNHEKNDYHEKILRQLYSFFFKSRVIEKITDKIYQGHKTI